MLGVGPYITGSIIMQLLTIMVPALKRIYHEEGEAGRKDLLNIPDCSPYRSPLFKDLPCWRFSRVRGILLNLTAFDRLTNLFIVVAGSVFLMWIGELVSEFGIGNGVSLIAEKFPNDFAVNLIYGLSLSSVNEHLKAKDALQRALNINSDDVTALSAIGYTLNQLKKMTLL